MFSKALLMAGLAGMLCMSSWAQENTHLEVGIKGGAGAYLGDGSTSFGHVGVEVCAYCGGRYSLFGEYSHWLSSEQLRFGANYSADLFGVGLRIQGRRRVRPFFDIGLAVGRDNLVRDVRTNAGVVFGGGVMVPVGKHLYLRPQVRLYGMGEARVAASAEVGFGWRF